MDENERGTDFTKGAWLLGACGGAAVLLVALTELDLLVLLLLLLLGCTVGAGMMLASRRKAS